MAKKKVRTGPFDTAWVRLTKKGREELDQAWYDAYHDTPSPDSHYCWFSQIVDYREMCRRQYGGDWRTKVRKFLLWLADKFE